VSPFSDNIQPRKFDRGWSEPPSHDPEGWMVDGYETSFHWIPVPQVTTVVTLERRAQLPVLLM